MSATETEVEMAPGIAAYRNRFKQLLALRWINDGEQVARHGQIVGWAADSETGEQWLRLALTGRDKTIRIPARMLQRQLEAEEQERRLAEATRVERCEECGKVLDTGPLGYMDEFSAAPGLCYDCA